REREIDDRGSVAPMQGSDVGTLLSPPGASEKEIAYLFEGGPSRVRALPGHVTGLAEGDVLRPLVHERSPQRHHLRAVPDLVGRLLEQVAEDILAPEVPAAAHHAAGEVDREVDPGLM